MRGTIVRVQVERVPAKTRPPKVLWLWWAGPRLGHRAVLRLSWLLLVTSVALSTHPAAGRGRAPLAGRLPHRRRDPVWLLGSFAVLTLLYRTNLPTLTPDADAPSVVGEQGGKRERARLAYAALVAAGEPVTGARLAEAAQVSPSYGRALLAEFQSDPTHGNGQPAGQQASRP